MINISIIVPVYNGEKYISRCIDSLLRQTLDNLEIIIVDDGSTDNTRNILEEYELNNPNKIKLLFQQNSGQGKARNLGVEYARGQYIGFVDSDDYVDDNMFKYLYENAILNNSDLVICSYYRVNENLDILFSEMNQLNKDLIDINTSPWNKLYRKSLWIDYDIKFSEGLWYEDVGAVLPFLIIADKVTFIDTPLYYYVQRQGSSINLFSHKINDIFLVFDDIYNFIEKYCINNKKELIEYYFIMHLIFGHLSRCAVDNSIINRHLYIKTTKKYLLNKFPFYYKNKYFKLKTINKKPYFLFLIKYIGINLFYYNMYDLLLFVYHIQLKFSSPLKRW